MTIHEIMQLGIRNHQAGRLAEAEAFYRQVLLQQPNHAEALNLLGVIAGQVARYDLAADLIARAIAIKPGMAEYHANLGENYRRMGKLEQAITSLQRAVGLNPSHAGFLYNLGTAWSGERRFDEAIACYQRSLALQPDQSQVYNNLAFAYTYQGKLDEALASYGRAIELNPSDASAHSNRIYILHFHPAYDAAAILDEHRQWNRRHALPLQDEIRGHDNDRSPSRRLRIGYVSPYFRDHCQTLFTTPLFSHHDHNGFEIFCYSDVSHPDPRTDRLRSFADAWRDISHLDDAPVAALIREDKIDILVDLTVHMADNRLRVFARKPAPIQVTWLGCPATTGMDAMDYRLTDPYLDPPGSDAAYSEQSIRLPHSFWCYDPEALAASPPVGTLPATGNGFITFGSLNNFCKVTDAVLELWGRVLDAVTGSRLLLLTPPGSPRQHVKGILGDRVDFIDHQSIDQYLRTYQRIDMSLDPFPCNGHTTSLDSLWMGVPVITLVGNRAMGRAGWCQLNNLDLTELAAKTAEDYVRLAKILATDLPRLGALRSTLRDRMRNSPLMDAKGFARDIESAFRQMWRNWCDSHAQP